MSSYSGWNKEFIFKIIFNKKIIFSAKSPNFGAEINFDTILKQMLLVPWYPNDRWVVGEAQSDHLADYVKP